MTRTYAKQREARTAASRTLHGTRARTTCPPETSSRWRCPRAFCIGCSGGPGRPGECYSKALSMRTLRWVLLCWLLLGAEKSFGQVLPTVATPSSAEGNESAGDAPPGYSEAVSLALAEYGAHNFPEA